MPARETKANESKKLAGIFISYRRSDTPDAVGRIYDRLVSEFGKARVFKDVDSIPLGQDFRSHLNEIVGGCAAVLAIVGPRWVDTRNAAGQRRLEDPDDFVRIELEAALARSVPVVPVLVGHAPMPGSSELPTSLASMAFRQSIEVRPDPDFHNDATRLVTALRAIIDPNAPRAEPLREKQKRSWFPWMASLTGATTLTAIVAAVPALKHLRESPPREIRTEIVTPPTQNLESFALSPDGLQIAYTASDGGVERVWLRSLASSAARPLPGTDGATGPFWSPDSRSIGYFANNALKRLNLSDGVSQTLGPGGPNSTGTWNSDGVILMVLGPANPVLRIAASGGAATPVTVLDAEHAAHRFPQFLPDGRRFVFLSIAGTAPGIYIGSLEGGPPVRLTADTSPFGLLSSGWLIWSRSGALVAQQLDQDNSALVGDIVTIADKSGVISTSSAGLVAYRSTEERRLVLAWRDRSGNSLGTAGDPDSSYYGPSVSPDGRVAVTRSLQDKHDVWLMDNPRSSRLTFDSAQKSYPIWSPEGDRVVFVSRAGNTSAFYQKLASGTDEAEQLLGSGEAKFPSDWSRDGRYLLYFSAHPQTLGDIWLLPLTDDRKPIVLLNTPSFEVWPRLSPDGRWVAYASDESGRGEVYVKPFVDPDGEGSAPSLGSGRWQVSTAGGVFPSWSADGRELFFLNPSGDMMAYPMTVRGSALTPGVPVRLFTTRVLGGGLDDGSGRQYDVARDGRFLINEFVDADTATSPITLIQNWNPAVSQ